MLHTAHPPTVNGHPQETEPLVANMPVAISNHNFQSVSRILGAVILVQLIGALVGLVVRLDHFWFTNLWLGAAVATPIGFLAGLVWQLADVDRRQRTPVATTLGLGLLAFGFGAVAYFVVIPFVGENAKRLDQLRSLAEGPIRSIRIFDPYKTRQLVLIDDARALSAFASSCGDAQGYSPGQSDRTRQCYLVIDGNTHMEFECYFIPGQRNLYGSFIERAGGAAIGNGGFQSRQLRQWYEQFAPRQ